MRSNLLLRPLSMVFGAGVALRDWAYRRGWLRSWQGPVPVISVGNLSAGGSGKTPLTLYLLERLQAEGFQPAYLSRGYGRETRGYLRVEPGGEARKFGDEALMAARRFPHLPVAVCASRREGIERLTAAGGADLVLLDDAFQHRQVARDLDILVIDATRPPWADRLLPEGQLREPLSAWDRAGMLVFNKIQTLREIEALRSLAPPCPAAFTRYAPRELRMADGSPQPLSSLRGRPLLLLSGLGNPAYFEHTVREAGGDVRLHQVLADHQALGPADWQQVRAQARSLPEDAWILTSEKDFCRMEADMKAWHGRPLPIAWLGIGIEWLEGEELLWQRVQSAAQRTWPEP
jgi:tetraacyldisaccharide 4'-kinase